MCICISVDPIQTANFYMNCKHDLSMNFNISDKKKLAAPDRGKVTHFHHQPITIAGKILIELKKM